MPEEEATATRICAYWDALILDHDVGEVPLEADLARTIQHLHTLNIVVPTSAKDRVRDVVQASIERHPEGVSPMSSSILAAPHPLLTGPMQKDRWESPAAPRSLVRGRFAAFAGLAVLVLMLAALSLPYIGSRLGGPADDLVVIPALLLPDLATPAAVQEITGGDDPKTGASGVAVAADGTLYVIDVPRDHVRVFNADGTPKATWGESGDGPGEFEFSFDLPAGDLAIAPDGNLYVLDPNLARIQTFSPDGTFLFAFGERGSNEGQMLYPQGIGIGPDGHVYVADWQNHRVQVFDDRGTLLASWDGTAGGGSPLAGPNDVAVTPDGTVWVTDAILQQIIGFAPDGTIVGTIGNIGDESGELRGPWGITVDALGNLYVAEYDNDRVQGFSPDGTPLGIVGTSGDELGQLNAPTFLAVGPDGSLYVAEEGNGRIQRFPPDSLIPPNILVTAEPSS